MDINCKRCINGYLYNKELNIKIKRLIIIFYKISLSMLFYNTC